MNAKICHFCKQPMGTNPACGFCKDKKPSPQETRPPETKPPETRPPETRPAGTNSTDEILFLKAKLDKAQKGKQVYSMVSLGLALSILLLFGIIYYTMVLEYAELANITIKQVHNSRKVEFEFEVSTPGRLDYYYGKTYMSESREEGMHGFSWAWGATNENIEVSVRSREGLFPSWKTITLK